MAFQHFIVETRHGRLRGGPSDPGTLGFFGIPYARPPVGNLRWRPPVDCVAWSGVRDAVRFGDDPIQPSGLRTSRAPTMSEDCLYLNVWMPPDDQPGGWPVLVWLCGGGFTTGSGAFEEENPARLAARGAVVVSVNVRLNVFGFFAHPDLSAESPNGSCGNYGLHDMAAALRWVRANIAAFGGDADRITFFGESAGATIGMLLLASPIADRPYDRAIFQSPGAFDALLDREAAEHHGANLGVSVEELRLLSAPELAERAQRLPRVAPSLWLRRPLRPVVDGWLLREDDPLQGPDFRPVPAVIGTNEDEGRFFEARMGVKTIEDLADFAGSIFGKEAGTALERYAAQESSLQGIFSAIYGDRGVNFPIDRLVRRFAQTGSETYRYVYTYRHGTIDRAPTHSEELGVLMDTLPRTTADDGQMSEEMMDRWLAFAATGKPDRPGMLEWPRFDPQAGRFLNLAVPTTTGAHWRSEDIAFVARHHID